MSNSSHKATSNSSHKATGTINYVSTCKMLRICTGKWALGSLDSFSQPLLFPGKSTKRSISDMKNRVTKWRVRRGHCVMSSTCGIVADGISAKAEVSHLSSPSTYGWDPRDALHKGSPRPCGSLGMSVSCPRKIVCRTRKASSCHARPKQRTPGKPTTLAIFFDTHTIQNLRWPVCPARLSLLLKKNKAVTNTVTNTE